MKFTEFYWQKFDEYHLRRSLRTLVTYADSDSLTEVEGSDFPDQVSIPNDWCDYYQDHVISHRSGTWRQTCTGYYWILLKCKKLMRFVNYR